MKRHVKRLSYLGAVLIAALMLTGCILVFDGVQRSEVREHLIALTRTADALMGEAPRDYAALASLIASGEYRLRVTFLDGQGNVLADSGADAGQMESHLDRPEIQTALSGGIGAVTRRSETTGIQTIYAAKLVGEGLILRLSCPASTAVAYWWRLLPVVAVLTVLTLVAVPLFARRLENRVSKPLIRINEMLLGKGDEGLPTEDAEPEVRPILDNIGYLIEKLRYDFEEVQKTQQLRTDFIANASHELKSPLTSIKGFAELLAGGMVADKEKQKAYLNRIVSESDRLLNIINDILRLSKAEGRVMEKAEFVSLQPLVREVIQALEPLARMRGITVTMDGVGRARANARDIWELTYNLVDNAIRYGKPGGRAAVHIGDFFLSVEDDGIGMEAEHLTRIFERFYRIDKSHSRLTGGTGLGLSIVKHIAQNYGARLQVKSTPGEGSTFSVQFPFDKGLEDGEA